MNEPLSRRDEDANIFDWVVIGAVSLILSLLMSLPGLASNTRLASHENAREDVPLMEEVHDVFQPAGDIEAGSEPAVKELVPGFTIASMFKGDVPIRGELAVPVLFQYPDWPTGCEVVSMAEVLSFHGFNVLPGTLVEEGHLELSDDDYVNAFLGDPSSYEGATVMPPGLAQATSSFLASRPDRELSAYWGRGIPLDDVVMACAAGYPSVAWTTIGTCWPGDPVSETEDGYRLYELTHAVVIAGYDLDEGSVLVADPIYGDTWVDLDAFRAVFDEMGGLCATVLPEPHPES